MGRKTVLFLVTEDWYFCSHRLAVARAARDAGYKVSVVCHENSDGNRIRSEALEMIPMNLRRGEIGFGSALRSMFALWRIIRDRRPLIVHNVAIKPVILGTVAARLAGATGVINAIAGLGYVFTSKESRAIVLRVFASFCFRVLFRSRIVRVIVQNRSDEAVVERLGVPKERITLIAGSGVDTREFVHTAEPQSPTVVAMVSRMLWDKGVGDLVKASSLLRKSGEEIRVRLVGPTDPANPSSIPESILNGWMQEETVEWAGPLSDVAGVWASAHIAVLPSYREGLPKSLLEGAACGRPLIATNVPGCRDVVIHGETGLLVPPRDPEALAAAILQLARDPELRARLGKAARERVEQHFSVDKVVEETLSLYRTILAAA